MPESCRVLITGGNAGIGRAAARQLAEAGCHVLLGCRDEGRGAQAASELLREVPGARVDVLPIDMSLQRSIRRAASQIDKLDGLIHNAAYFDIRAKSRTETPEGIETTWATNHLGPALLTELLLPHLRESARNERAQAPVQCARNERAQAPVPGARGRVVAVTSKGLVMFPRLAVNLDDPEFKNRRFSVPRAYYQSKLAHLTWMLDQAERSRDSGIRFHGIRVTNVKIDLGRYPGLGWFMRALYRVKSAFAISPEQMARAYTWAVMGEDAAATRGGYWDSPGVAAPVSKWAKNRENQKALAAFTERQITGLNADVARRDDGLNVDVAQVGGGLNVDVAQVGGEGSIGLGRVRGAP